MKIKTWHNLNCRDVQTLICCQKFSLLNGSLKCILEFCRDPTYNSFLSDSFFLRRAITDLSCENGGAIIYFLNSKTIQLSGFIIFQKNFSKLLESFNIFVPKYREILELSSPFMLKLWGNIRNPTFN